MQSKNNKNCSKEKLSEEPQAKLVRIIIIIIKSSYKLFSFFNIKMAIMCYLGATLIIKKKEKKNIQKITKTN